MPARDAVARKELAPARARQPHDVLDIGKRAGHRADRCSVQRATHRRESEHAHDSTPDLELPRVDVLVRHPVAEKMQDRPQERGRHRGTDERATRGARGNV
jgi:hypothetical protein